MRWSDYMRLAWDQLKRRKVVTAMCAAGIAIGSASIMVALAFGESVSYYSQRQFEHYAKTDEITVFDQPDEPITEQKLAVIRTLPHVVSLASYRRLGQFKLTVDGDKTAYVDVTATELDTLQPFGYEFAKGSGENIPNGVILSYGTTLSVQDERKERMLAQLGGDRPDRDPRKRTYVPYPLYQKQITLTRTFGEDTDSVTVPLRVTGILKKPEGRPDYVIASENTAYISSEMGQRLARLLNEAREAPEGERETEISELKVKVDSAKNVPAVEKQIQLLKLNTSTNIHWQERMKNEFLIVRLIFAGAGLFVLCVASISIIVAMTMSTYQRRRQIGIMKVLGANLKQIRNMFIFESALLGVLGGMLGIAASYWVVWGINLAVKKFAQADELLFISWWVLPVGLGFALLTGVLSGIYPAVKASRTDALTAIRRE